MTVSCSATAIPFSMRCFQLTRPFQAPTTWGRLALTRAAIPFRHSGESRNPTYVRPDRAREDGFRLKAGEGRPIAAGGGRFGSVLVEGSQITGFREKAEVQGSEPEFMNMGLYLLSRDILSAIPPGKSSLETDVFPELARQGRLEAQIFDPAFFIDIGVPEDFAKAQTALPKALAKPESAVKLS
jgi:hypothetical protein